MAAAIAFFARIAIWSIVFLAVLSNLGVEVDALIAGLGITGIAVAFALQNVLGDLFASLSIYFDRPFDIGDFIIVDDYMGNVDKIGMRSTRIRSLGGEQIVFANSDLARVRIRNYRRMRERRIFFAVGIEYNVAYEKVELAPKLLREAIEETANTRFDRAHFKSFGDFSLNYEIVYWVLAPDFPAYMDAQHAINLAIYKKFEDAGIPFAFPTRTLHIKADEPLPIEHHANGREARA
jgi:small-conductance mechanosensitive channel